MAGDPPALAAGLRQRRAARGPRALRPAPACGARPDHLAEPRLASPGAGGQDPPPAARDSITLLRSGLESGDAAEADRLAEALGDLPLALAQAAAFVRETGITFAEYLQRFRTRRAELERDPRAEPGYGRPVAATLALALDRLRGGQEGASPAERLLARGAFYAPDRIPRDLLADEFPDDATLDEAIRTLRSYSLVETDAGTVTVHRLVQRAVRDRMDPEVRAAFAEFAVQQLDAKFPTDPDDVRTWPECRKLLDHALHAAEQATEHHVAASSIARLLNQVGIHLWAASDLPRAKEVLWRALRIKEASYGPDHPEVVRTLGNLGIVAKDQGDLAEARRCLERALGIKEASYGPDHPEVARTLGNLGIVAKDQGDLAEARRCLERALGIKEASYGPDHPEVARTLGNLGIVAKDQGDLAEARRCLERALRIEEASFGPDHPEVALTLGNLGFVLVEDGELARAKPLVEQALGIFRKFLGDEHPHTLWARQYLQEIEERSRGQGEDEVSQGQASNSDSGSGPEPA